MIRVGVGGYPKMPTESRPRFEVASTMEQERDTSHHEPRRREMTFSRDKTAEAAGDLGEIVNRAELVPHYRFVRIN